MPRLFSRAGACWPAALALVFLPLTLAAQERRAMTTDDGLDMKNVGTGLISPDGAWVLYSLSELDWDENKRETRYYMISAEGGEAWQYIGEAGASDVQFSPDGRYLSFKRTVDKKAQLFLMPTRGGEAVQLSKHKTAVGTYRCAPDGDAIVFAAADAKPDSVQKEVEKGDDAIFVDEGPNGQRPGDWSNLWTIDIGSREERQITREEFRVTGFDVGPDRRIVATIRFENRRNQGNLTEIFLIDPDTGARTRLTDNRAPESGVEWAPDGRRISYTAPSDGEWELRLSRIWVMDTETRNARVVSGGFSGNISNITWTPDSRALLFNGLHRTNTNVYRLDVGSGRVEQLTDVEGTLRATSFSRDRTRMVYSFQDFDTPPDLFASATDRHDPTRLTHANPAIETDLALARLDIVRWNSRDGLEIEGLMALPAEYRPGQRRPLLLHIHG